ncbi:AMP-binding protein [Alteromonas sediminis]|uniref:AMP-binding protein n=1 Tax=Alteromonas sediminis TaxID=2259342 RepID=UPI00140531D8|nr:AMP-binding protein [Alteromonas sediminis]
MKGQTNLLPPNRNVATQAALAETYPESYVIHDGQEVDPRLPNINVLNLSLQLDHDDALDVPQINNAHLACICFTSGSTGNAKPVLKYWQTFTQSTSINAQYMLPDTSDTLYQLATMPAQHMWGLETSILLPMFHNVCLCDAQPLFPQDILDALSQLPEPRMLVSTPVHMRALTSDSATKPNLDIALCATSPLTQSLAVQIEAQFNCQLREVYGCSEVGSMAVRQTAEQEAWRRFNGLHFAITDDETLVSAEHLPQSVVLQDKIIAKDETHFMLAGRASDLVKVAGKRGSLFEINQHLLRFEGLVDGIVLDRGASRLHAIVALKKGYDKSQLVAYLRHYLDSAFVPRPIYVVDALPRESNGKLSKRKVDELFASLK